MQYEVNTVQEYIEALPEDRKPVIEKLRQVILANLPEGFEEQISYGMISYVVPLSRYPQGYHVKRMNPCPLSPWHLKRTILPCIIWACTGTRN
jgi:hypothetical protein